METLKRFWCQRDAIVHYGPGGYLVDPGSRSLWQSNPSVTEVDLLVESPCIVLLGEAGIGKSHTMKALRTEVAARADATESLVLWVDLHEFGSDFQLESRLFQSPIIERWREGKGTLYLILDSLDECRLSVRTLYPLLLSQLGKWDSSRLQLRIACRTPEWSRSFEKGLSHVFGESNVDVRELLPLTRQTIVDAAQSAGLSDVDRFMAAVDSLEAQPFAMRPITLQFLVNLFKRYGGLPATRRDLYLQGTRLLCEETERRVDVGLRPELRPRRRATVAGRIAAFTLLGNRAAIWTDVDRGDVPDGDVPIDDLSGGEELDDEEPFGVDDAAVRSTLNTGLFSSRGLGRLGWAHQSYAEFLAAQYLVDRQLELPQIMSLITNPGDPEGLVVPQLHGCASWLGVMRNDVLQEIAGREPDILLRSDLAQLADRDRASIVQALLSSYENGTLFDFEWWQRRAYGGLRHPGLTSQIRPYITDSSMGQVARRAAINIGRECQLRDLVPDLIAVSLRSDDSPHIRAEAAYAVAALGTTEQRAELKPLLEIDPDLDPDDELKGCGLRAAWPESLTTQELLESLSPARGHLVGAYRGFLSSDPMAKLPTTDIPRALAWVNDQLDSGSVSYEFERLIRGVIQRAWEQLENGPVLQSLARTVALHGHHIGSDLHDLGKASPTKRLKLLEEMVSAENGQLDLSFLLWDRFVLREDFDALMDRMRHAAGTARETWAKLVVGFLHSDDRYVVDALLVEREGDDVLARLTSRWFDPVALESEVARGMKREHQAMRVLSQTDEECFDELDPPPHQRVLQDLERLESGDLNAWWHLNNHLMLEYKAAQHVSEFESDLTSLPGWSACDEATRRWIVRAAEQYVNEQEPSPKKWITDNPAQIIYRPDWAAFRAFRLMQLQAPDRLSDLSPETWRKWASTLLAFPLLDPEGRGAQACLVAAAYRHNAEEVISTLLLLLDKENKHGQGYVDSPFARMASIEGGKWVECLLAHARKASYAPPVLNQMLEALADHDLGLSADFALDVLCGRIEGYDLEASAAAASFLLRFPESGQWDVAWNAIASDEEFGERVLHWIVFDERREGRIAAHLDERQLTEAFVLLSRRYPQDQDLIHDGVVEFRHAVGDWRDSLLSELKRRGTLASVKAIQEIRRALPEHQWIDWILYEANRTLRQLTWSPPQISDIKALVQSPDKRWVPSADALLELVLESLTRFQRKLQIDEPPFARHLWNDKPVTPKDENSLSDMIKAHFDTDLRDRRILINREVENRRGEETDIRVEAFGPEANGGPAGAFVVVLEVKGAWHRELKSAMQTQLVDRYMRNNAVDHGVFVVGWYASRSWDVSDWRRAKVPRSGIEDVRQQLDMQAASLSEGGLVVRSVVLDVSIP